MNRKAIYLDSAATTKLAPEVLEKMMPFLTGNFGNPSSIHSFGREAKVAIENSRETIAEIINAHPSEIYFTSGGTEANNIALKGILTCIKEETNRNKVIISNSEHHSILDSAKYFSELGFDLVKIPVTNEGIVCADQLDNHIDDRTALVSLIYTNNETGAVNPIKYFSKIVKSKNTFFHTDAVQAFGKYPIDVYDLGVDALSASAHKINGPKGTGMLYLKNGTPFTPLTHGGSQERNRRGGTENVAGIIGLAEALRLITSKQKVVTSKVTEFKKYFENRLLESHGDKIRINSNSNCSPFILSITFLSEYFKNDPESIFMFLDINGIAASNGAACSSGTVKTSHTISALGYKDEDARGTIRFSFSEDNTLEEINYTLSVIESLTNKIKLK